MTKAYMELSDTILKRYSVRNFKNEQVPREKIMELMEYVRMAPSAVNYQPWHFIILTNRGNIENLAKAYPRPWLISAPVIIVACINRKESWRRIKDNKDFGDVDVAIAIDHMTLAATSMGLGTCWVCNFDVDICKKMLELPDHMEPLAIIPLGYPINVVPEKKRKSMDEIVSWEKYYPYK
jgi:nitroreductase